MNLLAILTARIARISALIPRMPEGMRAEMRESLAIERDRLRLAKQTAPTVRIVRV